MDFQLEYHAGGNVKTSLHLCDTPFRYMSSHTMRKWTGTCKYHSSPLWVHCCLNQLFINHEVAWLITILWQHEKQWSPQVPQRWTSKIIALLPLFACHAVYLAKCHFDYKAQNNIMSIHQEQENWRKPLRKIRLYISLNPLIKYTEFKNVLMS